MRTLDRFCDIGDRSVAPATYFVTKEPESASGACPNRPLGDNSTHGTVTSAHRCLLDHEPSFRDAHHERRVIEVAAISVFETRCQRLEDAPVQSNRVTARGERQPVKIDAGYRGT
jgi:hypothetical protein